MQVISDTLMGKIREAGGTKTSETIMDELVEAYDIPLDDLKGALFGLSLQGLIEMRPGGFPVSLVDPPTPIAPAPGTPASMQFPAFQQPNNPFRVPGWETFQAEFSEWENGSVIKIDRLPDLYLDRTEENWDGPPVYKWRFEDEEESRTLSDEEARLEVAQRLIAISPVGPIMQTIQPTSVITSE